MADDSGRLGQDTAIVKCHIHAGLRWGYRTHSKKEMCHPYTVRRGRTYGREVVHMVVVIVVVIRHLTVTSN